MNVYRFSGRIIACLAIFIALCALCVFFTACVSPGQTEILSSPEDATPEPSPIEPIRPIGPWFGQALPSPGPVVFSPDFISIPGAGSMDYDTMEYGCSFSSDLREFYFSRGNTIMFTRQEETGWTSPEVIVSNAHEPCLTPDGKTLYFGSWNALPAGVVNIIGNYGIWAKDREANGWGKSRYIGQGMYVSTAADGSLYVTEFENSELWRPARVSINEGRFSDFERLGGGIAALEPAHKIIAHPAIAPDQGWILFDFSGEHLMLSFRMADGTWGTAIDLTEHGFKPQAGIASIAPDGKTFFWHEDGDLMWASVSIIEALRPLSTGSGR